VEKSSDCQERSLQCLYNGVDEKNEVLRGRVRSIEILVIDLIDRSDWKRVWLYRWTVWARHKS